MNTITTPGSCFFFSRWKVKQGLTLTKNKHLLTWQFVLHNYHAAWWPVIFSLGFLCVVRIIHVGKGCMHSSNVMQEKKVLLSQHICFCCLNILHCLFSKFEWECHLGIVFAELAVLYDGKLDVRCSDKGKQATSSLSVARRKNQTFLSSWYAWACTHCRPKAFEDVVQTAYRRC